MAAPENLLSKLHEMQTQALIKALEDGYMIVGYDGEGEAITQPLTPAFFQAVSKFLKDNEITCAPAEGSDIEALDKARKERLEKRNSRRVARTTEADAKLAAAGGGSDFLGGMDPLMMQ